MPATPPAPVDHLRRLVDALAQGRAPDAEAIAWLVLGARDYLAEAADGLTLDDALELSPKDGRRAWWLAEALNARNEAIVTTARKHFPKLTLRQQAEQIARVGERCEATTWARAEHRDEPPPELRGRPEADLWRALKAAASLPGTGREREHLLPKARQLRSILAGGSGQ